MQKHGPSTAGRGAEAENAGGPTGAGAVRTSARTRKPGLDLRTAAYVFGGERRSRRDTLHCGTRVPDCGRATPLLFTLPFLIGTGGQCEPVGPRPAVASPCSWPRGASARAMAASSIFSTASMPSPSGLARSARPSSHPGPGNSQSRQSVGHGGLHGGGRQIVGVVGHRFFFRFVRNRRGPEHHSHRPVSRRAESSAAAVSP